MSDEKLDESLKNLQDSGMNLDKVAEYCEVNYFQSDNKKAAFAETKDFVTQSLASVAYQIDCIAYNFLQKLDKQGEKIRSLSHNIDLIQQTVRIKEEKMARQKIGVLSSSKSSTESFKIIAPSIVEKPMKYQRQPIDYSILDNVGHGKSSQSLHDSSWKMTDSIGDISVISRQSEPMPKLMTYEQVATLRTNKAGGSLSALQELSSIKWSSGERSPRIHCSSPSSIGKISQSSLQRAFLFDHSISGTTNKLLTSSVREVARPKERPPLPPEFRNRRGGAEKVIVVFEYEAQKQDELDLKEGRCIEVTNKNDDGWWEGIDDRGKCGLFPSNYVQQIA